MTLEYVGDTTFPSCDLKPQSTLEDWLESARHEFQLCRTATAILNMDDKELEEYGRALGDDEDAQGNALMDIYDWLDHWEKKYLAGAETTGRASLRLLVIAERLHGREQMARIYAD